MNPESKNNVGGIPIPYFKVYYNLIIVKIVL